MHLAARIVGAAALLLAAGLPLHAKPVTMADITVDLPSDFKAADSDRGMKTQTRDGEVDVWFERYPAGASDKFVSENATYWIKNKVELPNEPTVSSGKFGAGIEFKQLDFDGATWKGKPTVVRYVFFQPKSDPKADMIVVTIWASPEGDAAHSEDVTAMIATAKYD